MEGLCIDTSLASKRAVESFRRQHAVAVVRQHPFHVLTCWAPRSVGVVQVRSMKDNFGDKVAATPSTAVQMSGLHVVPVAGDDFTVAKTLDEVC